MLKMFYIFLFVQKCIYLSIGNLPSNNTSPIQPQALSTPVNTSALAVLSGLSADRLGLDTQNRRSCKCISLIYFILVYFNYVFINLVGGVNGLGNLSASDLGIGTGGLGAPFGAGMNTSGGGSLNNSSLHQSNLIILFLNIRKYLIFNHNIILYLKYIIIY